MDIRTQSSADAGTWALARYFGPAPVGISATSDKPSYETTETVFARVDAT